MKVAIYSRVSTQEQAINGNSIHEQVERMEKYCEAMKWSVYKKYTDAGFSGANTNRPALKKMIKDIKTGEIDKVLVYKLDRLSRSQLDTLYLIEKVFLINSVDFVSMTENFDTSTPFGKAMIGILSVFAQLEREQIKERMMMGKEARAKKGLYHGSKFCPIGYDYKDGQLITNDFEKMQIVSIFEMYANGTSPSNIAKELNLKGYKTKYGQWKDATVRKILQRKTYLGYTKYHDNYYKGEHEPFISEELFNTVQKIYKRKSKEYSYNKRTGKVNSYLGGLIECGVCGAKYTKVSPVTKRKGKTYKYEFYRCNFRNQKNRYKQKEMDCKNKTWKMEELDDYIFEEIKRISFNPDYINELSENGKENQKIIIINNKISELDSQIDKLLDLYSTNQIPEKHLQNKIQEFNSLKESLEEELDKIEDNKKTKLSKKEIIECVDSFEEVLENGDFNKIREILTTLIEKIVIYDEEIQINWRFK